MTTRPIIVLGPERSGTSLITEMIVRWGAYPGADEYVRGPDQHNQNGYWEYTPVWDALAAMGVDWWDEGFQEQLAAKAQVPEFGDRARTMIAEMERPGRPWVWKDPALSFFLPFWQQFWRDPVYVVAVRHPLDTARSWERFILPPGAVGKVDLVGNNLLRWQYIVALVLTHTEQCVAKVFVSYEEILAGPDKQAARLAATLDEFCGRSTGEQTRRHMAGAVEPGLQHQCTAVPFSEATGATHEQKRLYGELLRKVRDPDARVRVEEEPMPQGWREVVKAGEAKAAGLRNSAGV